MRVDTTLLRGRKAAESLMVSACTITRQSPGPVDPVTGAITPVTDTVYDGVCKIQFRTASGWASTGGNVTVTADKIMVHLPVGSAKDLKAGDAVTITANPADERLVGSRFIVTSVPASKTLATALRFEAEASGVSYG